MALGSGPGGIRISGESLKEQLVRAFRPGVEAAIVRPKPFPDAEAWVIDETVTGGMRDGGKLSFSRCRQVLRIGSTPEYLRSLLTEVPVVVEAELERPRSLILPTGRELSDFDSPLESDRFLLLFEPRAEGWAFAVQTVGDLYLLREERVFRLEWAEVGGNLPIRIWAPIPELSATALIDRVRAGLEQHPDDLQRDPGPNSRNRPTIRSGNPRS